VPIISRRGLFRGVIDINLSFDQGRDVVKLAWARPSLCCVREQISTRWLFRRHFVASCEHFVDRAAFLGQLALFEARSRALGWHVPPLRALDLGNDVPKMWLAGTFHSASVLV